MVDRVAVIVGSILGGIVLLAAFLAAIVVFVYRYKRLKFIPSRPINKDDVAVAEEDTPSLDVPRHPINPEHESTPPTVKPVAHVAEPIHNTQHGGKPGVTVTCSAN